MLSYRESIMKNIYFKLNFMLTNASKLLQLFAKKVLNFLALIKIIVFLFYRNFYYINYILMDFMAYAKKQTRIFQKVKSIDILIKSGRII